MDLTATRRKLSPGSGDWTDRSLMLAFIGGFFLFLLPLGTRAYHYGTVGTAWLAIG